MIGMDRVYVIKLIMMLIVIVCLSEICKMWLRFLINKKVLNVLVMRFKKIGSYVWVVVILLL